MDAVGRGGVVEGLLHRRFLDASVYQGFDYTDPSTRAGVILLPTKPVSAHLGGNPAGIIVNR